MRKVSGSHRDVHVEGVVDVRAVAYEGENRAAEGEGCEPELGPPSASGGGSVAGGCATRNTPAAAPRIPIVHHQSTTGSVPRARAIVATAPSAMPEP